MPGCIGPNWSLGKDWEYELAPRAGHTFASGSNSAAAAPGGGERIRRRAPRRTISACITTALGRLVLTDQRGREYHDVEPIRAFPIAEPDRGISICDDQGHELFWIERLADLPAEVRATIELDLSRREFNPVIQRIVRMAAFAEPSEWEVETDRGPTKFLLGNAEDVHRLEGGRAMIIDTNGVRYLIPDARARPPQPPDFGAVLVAGIAPHRGC